MLTIFSLFINNITVNKYLQVPYNKQKHIYLTSYIFSRFFSSSFSIFSLPKAACVYKTNYTSFRCCMCGGFILKLKFPGRASPPRRAASLIVSIVAPEIGDDELADTVDRVHRDNFDLSPVTGAMFTLNWIGKTCKHIFHRGINILFVYLFGDKFINVFIHKIFVQFMIFLFSYC